MLGKKDFLLFLVFIGVIALSRFLPHPWNFTPVGALALFGGAVYKNRQSAIFLTFLVLYLTDFVLNNFVHRGSFTTQSGIIWFSNYMLWVYGGFLAMFLIANKMLRKFSYSKMIFGSLAGSIAFFLITNFGSWLFFDMYTKDFAGLMSSYVNGIPFFKYTVLGDLLYSAAIFYVYNQVTAKSNIRNLAFS
jgi:hypothetical protein